MAAADQGLPLPAGDATDPPHHPRALRGAGTKNELASAWRKLARAATIVALLTSPAVYAFWYSGGHSWWGALLLTLFVIGAFRGLVDLALHRFIPWPSLFGTDDTRLKEEDVVSRRRVWFWRFWYRIAAFLLIANTVVWAVRNALGSGVGWFEQLATVSQTFGSYLTQYAPIMLIFLLINVVILVGPLMAMGVGQIKSFEPGDANWGVKLDDVRGQAEPKEEIRRVVDLWQSGDVFEQAGGKRERGLLFVGPPGTGKTMLAKAVATGFNCPFVTIPGSGFAQTFIGMDAVIVRYLAFRAKRLARKWGGQCIVFIDEIDAVGMRRASLGGATGGRFEPNAGLEEICFDGPWGAVSGSGDLILETRAWRERLFRERGAASSSTSLFGRLGVMIPGMMGGGGLALNQLLVVMDGIGNPRFSRRLWTNNVNKVLDALYVIPRRIGSVSLRVPPAKPSPEQIYFIGACNVPIEMLDPALTRPGRMGRHIWFRTPTKDDRKDIFDLYLGKVSHEPDLDAAGRRDEIARITNGYSPAMIEQVTSMALTVAHHEGRMRFGWGDLVDAMTTVEAGTALNIEYTPDETKAVAIHEAGHAVCAHLYLKEHESSRLSIRMRGGSLGHHQVFEKDERFTRWRSEQMAYLIWGLGAMAAERVFYGENSNGVGGDVGSTSRMAAWMVGASAMLPFRIDLDGKFKLQSEEDEEREKIMKRFERIGLQIMNRITAPSTGDSIAAILADPDKRRTAGQILGQAYVIAHNICEANRGAIEKLADTLVERREMYGDEVVETLDSLGLVKPEVDYTQERSWPKL